MYVSVTGERCVCMSRLRGCVCVCTCVGMCHWWEVCVGGYVWHCVCMSLVGEVVCVCMVIGERCVRVCDCVSFLCVLGSSWPPRCEG